MPRRWGEEPERKRPRFRPVDFLAGTRGASKRATHVIAWSRSLSVARGPWDHGRASARERHSVREDIDRNYERGARCQSRTNQSACAAPGIVATTIFANSAASASFSKYTTTRLASPAEFTSPVSTRLAPGLSISFFSDSAGHPAGNATTTGVSVMARRSHLGRKMSRGPS